jgi:histidinol phosphatase-like PHP family hydrolase
MSRTVVLVRAGWHDRVMPLPPDGHVHSEWSWDAPNGSMEKTCSRAVEMGLPAVAFTEHADLLHGVYRAEQSVRVRPSTKDHRRTQIAH